MLSGVIIQQAERLYFSSSYISFLQQLDSRSSKILQEYGSRTGLLNTNKSSPGDEPWGVKECEAACACRSPVTQKSRSQARPPLDALQQSSALASEDYSSQSDKKSNSEAWNVQCCPGSVERRQQVWMWLRLNCSASYVLSFFTIRRVIGTATVNGQRR